jgi:hypothetical protein
MAGYSGTPLQQKLGLKEGFAVAYVSPPKAFGDEFVGVQARVQVRGRVTAPLDAAVLFTTSEADLRRRAPNLLDALGDTGMLWVAWPKKSSGVPTDLTEQTLREVLLPTGWVDTKVCAVDDTWSGLKFVKRLSERAGTPRTRNAGRR